jgi:hypothetical protein
MISARDILRLIEMGRNDRADAERSLQNNNILNIGIHLSCICFWGNDINVPHWKDELSVFLWNALSDLVRDSRSVAGTNLTSVRKVFFGVKSLARAVDGRTASALSRALAHMKYPPTTRLDRIDHDWFSSMGIEFHDYVHPRLGINFTIMLDGDVIADTGKRTGG